MGLSQYNELKIWINEIWFCLRTTVYVISKDISSYFTKGFLNTLGNNLIPVAFSSLALATKGTMSKIGAWGVAGYGLFTVLKEGFGLGKNTPVD